MLLDDTVVPDTIRAEDGSRIAYQLTNEEAREACRALKGSMLRQEVYALDGSEEEDRPFSVEESNYSIELLQPRADDQHAVFFTHPRETVTLNYERKLFKVAGAWLADPRVRHTLSLDVDEFGNVLKSAAIGYGRRHDDTRLRTADRATQAQTLSTYTETRVTNAIDLADDFRTPLPCESRTFELTGLAPPDLERFTFDDVLDAGTKAAAIPYEEDPTPGVQQKRLIEHVQTLYRSNDLSTALPIAELQSLALPFESYSLALTPGLLEKVYGDRVNETMLEDEARYVHSEGDANWWIPSGRFFYSPDAGHTPPEEQAYARQHFFLPQRYCDPFHTGGASTESFVSYDPYDLLVQETRDVLGNRITVGERNIDPVQPFVRRGHDYRVLQPTLIMDPNRNRTVVAFDAIGMVVATAVMGKPEENPVPGDRLERTFRTDLTQAEIDSLFADPKGEVAVALLGDATTRVVYDLTSYWREPDSKKKQPVFAVTLARETHASEPVPADGLQIRASVSYSDGFGREIQRKIEAEPGPAPRRNGNEEIIRDAIGQPSMTSNDVEPRWVGSGWTMFNNKGKPVRQFDPFFTERHRFEFSVRIGVSTVLFYDALERVVASLHPNHTWEKVVFDPWRQETWDVNDTTLVPDPKADADVGDFFDRLPEADYLPTWHSRRKDGDLGPQEQAAAKKAAAHSKTPTVAHADSLGRTFLTVVHNRFKYSDTPLAEDHYRMRVSFDIEGNQREIIDSVDRVVMGYDYDLVGNRIHQASMEAGERWTLSDAVGEPLYVWDTRDHRFRTAYDRLRRPTDSFLRKGAADELLVGQTVYGETRPNPEAKNLRTRAIELRDQAGVTIEDEYDFKGNLLRSQRQLAQEYKTDLEWSGPVPLEAETHTSRTRYDALNRPTEVTAPDESVTRLGYNEANLLESIEVNLGGEAANGEPVWTPFITDVEYDARGLRTLIDYGNGVRTTYTYDPLTFRLMHLVTRRAPVDFPADCPQPSPADWPGCQVQNLHYTYDPAGNLTHIRDNAQQTIFFDNKRVQPSADYTYDAIYRLIEATGREHLGQVTGSAIAHSYNDAGRVRLLHPGDGNAMGRYLERYVYDAVGNTLSMQHRGMDVGNPGWTREFTYDEPSQLEPGKDSNRLTSSSISATTETYSTAGNGYDAHGNMLRMPHLQIMQWDFNDQLQMIQRQAVNAADDEGVQRQGERTWYVYGSDGQRVRKVTESATGDVKDERIYLGGFEVYRKYGANPLVRETLHITVDTQRIALVETRVLGNEPNVPTQLVRYQLSNHLGSAALELDDEAKVISYREYAPYGSEMYQAVRNRTEAAARYRYTGKERDDESGLYYHGTRYYAPWLARWTSCDPMGISDGVSLYVYVASNPTRFVDPLGTQLTTGAFEKAQELIQRHPEAIRAKTGWEQLLQPGGATRIENMSRATSPQFEIVSEGFILNQLREFGQRFKEDIWRLRPKWLGGATSEERVTAVAEALKRSGQDPESAQKDAELMQRSWGDVGASVGASKGLKLGGRLVVPTAKAPYIGIARGSGGRPPASPPAPFTAIPHEASPSAAVIQRLPAVTPDAKTLRSGSLNARTTARPNEMLDPSRTQGFKGEAPLPEGTSLRSWKSQGREFDQEVLETFQFDPKQPAHVRGWLRNEARRMAQGEASSLRRPPGYVLGHLPGKRASEGFDYTNSTLVTQDINELEVRAFLEFIKGR